MPNAETPDEDAARPQAELPQAERRNFYGRVHGKTLRASQKTYLAEDLGRLRLPGVTLGGPPGRGGASSSNCLILRQAQDEADLERRASHLATAQRQAATKASNSFWSPGSGLDTWNARCFSPCEPKLV